MAYIEHYYPNQFHSSADQAWVPVLILMVTSAEAINLVLSVGSGIVVLYFTAASSSDNFERLAQKETDSQHVSRKESYETVYQRNLQKFNTFANLKKQFGACMGFVGIVAGCRPLLSSTVDMIALALTSAATLYSLVVLYRIYKIRKGTKKKLS